MCVSVFHTWHITLHTIKYLKIKNATSNWYEFKYTFIRVLLLQKALQSTEWYGFCLILTISHRKRSFTHLRARSSCLIGQFPSLRQLISSISAAWHLLHCSLLCIQWNSMPKNRSSFGDKKKLHTKCVRRLELRLPSTNFIFYEMFRISKWRLTKNKINFGDFTNTLITTIFNDRCHRKEIAESMHLHTHTHARKKMDGGRRSFVAVRWWKRVSWQ